MIQKQKKTIEQNFLNIKQHILKKQISLPIKDLYFIHFML